jgi:ArsR family transcriptional regulator, arsenate/arsenite/antimonite-responsive transcriptional repressor
MTDEAKINVLKSLSEKARLDIVRAVRDAAGQCPSSVAGSCVQLAQPTLSHHFKKLVSAGVLIEVRKGLHKSYELNTPLFSQIGLDVNRL